MRWMSRSRNRTAGLPPGTPVYVGVERRQAPAITVFDYDETHVEERRVERVEDCLPFHAFRTTTWINVDGVHDVELIERLAAGFGVHPLVIEDIVNTTQRPKLEDFGDTLYLVVRMLRPGDPSAGPDAEQVSLVLGRNFVLSFQEQPGDVFEPVRERIRQGKGRVRKQGADYLAYALLDAVVDRYFSVFEAIGNRTEPLEETVMTDPSPETLRVLQVLRHDLVFLRRSIWPLRDVLSELQRTESGLVSKTTRVFLRDVHDHAIRVIDILESFRETASGLFDIYLSSVSNRMNEVMKVLTVIATIFIPLTFVAGIYGMNFSFMPELGWRWGYFASLGLMAAIAVGLVVFFRRRRWL